MLGPDKERRPGHSQGFPDFAVGVPCHNLEKVSGYEVAGESGHGLPVAEEIFRLGVPHREHVVIEVKELLADARYAVQEQFYGIAVERGKIFCRDYVLVKHYLQVAAVCPFRTCRRILVPLLL